MRLRFLSIIACIILFPMLNGCKASYPTGTVEDTIRTMCEKEYKVKVAVRSNNKTIGALIVAEDILLADLSFSDQALKKLEDVMLTTSHVTLSSEFPYDFFVVTILDAKTGVEISFVRYIKDIRRLMTDDISRNDYFQRLLIEAKLATPESPENAENRFALKDYQLSDFIAVQIAERLRTQFQISMVIERLFHIEGIKGEYIAGKYPQDGELRLTVIFDSYAPSFQVTGTPVLREDFLKLLYSTSRQIIKGYDFTDFSALTIVDQTGAQLARYERAEFSKGGMNTLMELIRSIQDKDK